MRRFVLGALTCALAGAATPCAADTWVLPGAKIYPAPDAEPIVDGVVLVREGHIVRVAERRRFKPPPGTRTSGCGGGVVVAGFQNSHVHFMEPAFERAASRPAAELERALEA